MRRCFLLALSLVSVAASAAAPAGGAPEHALSAAQIAERNAAARGGLDAWHAVRTLSLSGEMEAGGTKNTELPFVLKMKRPHMSRWEIRFQNQTAVQVYDGVNGWKLRPFLGRDDVEPFTAAEAKAAAAWDDLDGPLIDYAAKGTKVTFQGMDTVEGHSAYKLELTMKNGVHRQLWIDAATFLELKIDGQPRMLDGKMRNVEIFYRDYRRDHGLMVPHVLETVVEGGRAPHKMHIDRVTINPALDNAVFAKPQAAMAQVTRQ